MMRTVVFIILLTSSVVFGWGHLAPSLAKETQASRIIEDLATVTSATYQALVVDKLQRDGKGASSDYKKKAGFVPTPEAFMRRITLSVVKSNSATEGRFAFAFSDKGQPHFIVRVHDDNASGQEMAEVTAVAISQAIRVIRAKYTAMVVNKLQKDGAGASLDYEAKSGFVPLPAVFIRRILSAEGFQLVHTALRSRWNLNKEQHLQDPFEHEGWDFLVKQQQMRLASGKTLTNYRWQPYVKVMTQGNKKALRFLSADAASAQACVVCYNKMETQDDVKAMRKTQGVEVGKAFDRYELLGALSITVPLSN